MRIALITATTYPELMPDNALLIEPLRAHGITAEAAAWDDGSVNWDRFDAAIFRQPWNYFDKPDAFQAWLDEQPPGRPVWNPAAVIRRNMHKSYLRDLAAAGIDTVPTRWVDQGSDATLSAITSETGWDRIVVKPAVSAGAWNTFVVEAGRAAESEHEFASLTAGRDVMVQPFLGEIVEEGEWSMVFIDRVHAYSLLKRPADGDYRVQERHGGTTVAVEAPASLVSAAHDIVAAEEGDLLYARVDGIRMGGRFILIEVELFEPVLYFAQAPGSAEMFANAVARRMR